MTQFQLRVAKVAAELAGVIEIESATQSHVTNGTLEIKIARGGKTFETSFRRVYGCTLFSDEPTYE